MDVFKPTYALFWEGLGIGIVGSIFAIIMVWKLMTPDMRKAVIQFIDAKWTTFVQDSWRFTGQECPHRRPHF